MTLFVDTSAWYAAADNADGGNARAKAALRGGEELVTSDHILVESWILLRHRLGRPAAERFWEGLRSGLARLEPVTPVDMEVAWAIGSRFADQDFSIVDRTSFAVMERLGIEKVASLDSDFAVFRYGRNRDQAFVMVI
ncbi:MAG: PIN domain-containing protein [Candidatus Dormibacteraeota bacterium]|nr:PIN domain-containing protein [Candidatus Dormibacteraeota bacterium]